MCRGPLLIQEISIANEIFDFTVFTEVFRRWISRKYEHMKFIGHQKMNSEDLAKNNVLPFKIISYIWYLYEYICVIIITAIPFHNNANAEL
jgi:hypothetical protein